MNNNNQNQNNYKQDKDNTKNNDSQIINIDIDIDKEIIKMDHLKKKYKISKEQKQQETLNILLQLKNIKYPKNANAIKELIKICNEFIYNENISIKFNIPFIEIDKKILGILSCDKREKCVVLMRELSNTNNNF